MKKTALIVFAASLAGFASCASPPEVRLILLDTCVRQNALPDSAEPCGRPPGCESGVSFRDQAAYLELMAFPGGCPSDQVLKSGDTSGAASRVVVPATSAPPSLGELDKKSYGFAAVLRDANCGVVGFGCTAADMEVIREVRVSVRAWGESNICRPLTGGGCLAPATCVAGTCVSEAGPTDGPLPDGGGECSLQVVATGNLPDPMVPGAKLTGPEIAASPAGFVLGYREEDPATSDLRATVVSLGDAGNLGAPSTLQLVGCVGQSPSDGVGLAFAGSQGLMVASLADCGQGAGAAFIPVDGGGGIGAASSAQNPNFDELTLARTSALAPGVAGDEFVFAYRRVASTGPSAELAILQGNNFKQNTPVTTLFGGEASDFAMVGTSAQVWGILGHVPSQGAIVLQVQPAGGGAASETSFVDSGIAPRWGGVAAWSDRAAAVVPAGTGFAYKAIDLAGTDLGQGQMSGPAFRSGNLAVLGDHLLAVGSQAGSLTMFRVGGALGAALDSAPAATVTLDSASGVTSLAGFDGDHVAMAAARQRVALVWLTKTTLTAGDPTGGWAVLQCLP